MAPFLWFLIGGAAGGYLGSKAGLAVGALAGGGAVFVSAAAIRKKLSPQAQAEFDVAAESLTPEDLEAVLRNRNDPDLMRLAEVAKDRSAYFDPSRGKTSAAVGALSKSRGRSRSLRNQYATGGFNLGNVLGKIAKVAAGTGAAVASVLVPPLAPAGLPVAASLITSAVSSGQVTTAVVNPVWTNVSRVLAEAATELRASVSYDAQTTLHTASLVDRLATLAYDLALSPGNYAIETDFRHLGHWLSSHPRSEQLANYIVSHPALDGVFSVPDTVGQMPPRPPPPPPEGGFRGHHHRRFGGGHEQQQPGLPGGGHAKDSWQRWQRIHPGSSFGDYQGWWQQHGQYGAQIN